MKSNSEVASTLRSLGELLSLHGDEKNLAPSFTGAAFQLSRLSENVMEMNKAELNSNFRSDVVRKLTELRETGAIELFDELVQLTPSGIFEMMRIKGLGGKKLAVLWKQAGIDSMDALLKACKKNEVSRISGFGAKTQQNIIDSIEQYKSNEHWFHFATLDAEADKLVELLGRVLKTEMVSLCGDVRRKCNVVERIEIIMAVSRKKFITNKTLLKFLLLESESESQCSGHTANEIPFTIYFSSAEEYFYDLFIRTGNEKHVNKVLEKITGSGKKYESEQEIYAAAALPLILPELREDVAEWSFVSKKKIDGLICDEDIRGVVHNHTDWSDGIDSLKNFAMACKQKKYEYVVISDHSKNAHYAGGLKEEQVLRQHAEIDALNKILKPFKIFKSIECDILISGELDYSNDFLKCFDLVIISVHQLLKMSEEKATSRLLKAIENPYATILGHMTGRQLLIRPGYPVNFKKVIDACAANDVVIEINANPYRLDIDWSHIPYALKKGVMISVNPDAHSIGEIDNIHWGIVSARKGGLTKDMTWNAKPLKEIEEWILKKRKF